MKPRLGLQISMLFGEALVQLTGSAAMYVLISRIEGPERLGQYSLVLAWVLVFQAVAAFGIPEFLLREMGKSRDRSAVYAGQGFLVGSATSVAAMAIMVALVSILYREELRNALLLGTLLLPASMITSICRAGLVVHARTNLIFVFASTELLLTLPINAYLVLHHAGIVPLVETLVIVKVFIALMAFSVFVNRHVSLRFRLSSVFSKDLLSPLFTFAMSNALGLISLRVNLILLSLFGTLAAVGQFAAASKLLEVVLIIPGIFAQLALPQWAAHFSAGWNEGGEARYQGILALLFVSVFPLAVGMAIFAPLIISFGFSSDFMASVPIVRLLMIYVVIETADAMMGVTLKAAGYQRADLRLYVLNPLVNMIVSLALVPVFGGFGAAAAKLAGALCSSLSRYRFLLGNRLPVPVSVGLWLPLAASGLAGLCLILLGLQGHFITSLLYMTMAGAFLYLGYRLIGSKVPWLTAP